MNISTALRLSPLEDLKTAIGTAFVPTLIAVLKNPLLVLRPYEISRIFMAHVWKLYGDGTDANGRPAKQELLPSNCSGVVLDIGAGHGHTALYLDPTKVTKYVALEPNALMHDEIRSTAAKQGFTEAAGTLQILPYGAEQTALIVSALGGAHAVNTLVSILSLCTVPDPEPTLAALVRDVLKPGGTLLFYEHVLSPRPDVAWWQRFWAPVWAYAMDGCRLDRPTHVWVEKMDAWAEGSVWGKPDEPEEHLFWHRVGRFVKKSA
ncbi:hypothetical protein GSI_03749 [Ganoderma sinense ZZ0214-1]|uniref:Methyltransferase type 11 domain-containing protein n=1 Tax=Ganoderma sinense ZZ0214-1 TaxID=1077348 RepID=A0A2G8SJW3_9APHY|nr:hypothetical protein GSI_03749 [Ganoderma sinense ZZ0214-1]